MSPVRGKKAKSSSKAKKTSARPARSKAKPRQVPAAKSAKKATKPKATAKGKTAPAAKAASKGKAAGTERRHCAATDPFGDPCQSAPRMQSTYCTIHSYLDR
ncbi:MAG: hypothetical protein AABY18_04130 [Candidatus Thermoplasmatota archaeon]